MEQIEIQTPESYNTRNIPKAEFFTDVAAFIENHGGTSNAILHLEERLAKYKYMFNSFQSQVEQLRATIPTLHGTLAALEFIEEKGTDCMFHHQLVDGVYAKARITNNKKVSLFIGAGMFVEYSIEEAQDLITSNISDIEKQIIDLDHNLEVLKENMTVIEVSVSRVFNHDVQLRRQEKAVK